MTATVTKKEKTKKELLFTLTPFVFLALQSDRQQEFARDRPSYPRKSKKKKIQSRRKKREKKKRPWLRSWDRMMTRVMTVVINCTVTWSSLDKKCTRKRKIKRVDGREGEEWGKG